VGETSWRGESKSEEDTAEAKRLFSGSGGFGMIRGKAKKNDQDRAVSVQKFKCE